MTQTLELPDGSSTVHDREPIVIWHGEMPFGDRVIRAYVLEDGRRLLNVEDVAAFFMSGAKGTPSQYATLAHFCRVTVQ